MTNKKRDWRHFALLLIDVQQDFWPERMAESFSDFPANITRLLTLCRSEGIEIVHLHASFKPDMSDWMPRYKLLGRIPCIEGTAGVETLPFALDEPGEKVIIKQTFDGFHAPELLPYLERKRFVLTAGLVTSVCVFLTTASATQKGFLTAMIEDCCADQPESHEQTLDRYQFMFERVALDQIPERHSQWLASLKRPAELGETKNGI
ncbi:MAG: cysteine hydrolase [Anaerolineae bacterium]|nr:cysteine hydrolase [Anaerolineae bacterium]